MELSTKQADGEVTEKTTIRFSDLSNEEKQKFIETKSNEF